MQNSLFIWVLFVCISFQESYAQQKVDYRTTVLLNISAKIRDAIESKQSLPVIELRDNASEIAATNATQGKIFISTKTYQLCQTLGKDSLAALAFILGHEYEHYQKKEPKCKGFLFENTHILDKEEEKQADFAGNLYARLAGFSPCEVIDSFFINLYKTFKKGDNIPGYPSLNERIKMAKEQCLLAERYVDTFNFANLLMLTQHYEPASHLYENISYIFGSREIYFNQGITYLHQVLNASDSILKMPLGFDSETRLVRETTNHLNIADNPIFMKADSLIRKASLLDTSYFPAKITLLYMDIIGKKSGDSTMLKQIEDLHTNSTLENQQKAILLAICKVYLGDKAQAIAIFTYYKTQYPHQMRGNLWLLGVFEEREPFLHNIFIEKIADKSISQWTEKLKNEKTAFYIQKDNETMLYKYSHKDNYEAIFIQNINPNIPSFLGIKIGDKISEIERLYGKDYTYIYTPTKCYIYYKRNNWIVVMDKNQAVESWILFQTVEPFN